MNDIQIRLKMSRKQMGFTQKEIAEMLGITQQTYQQIEAGSTKDMRVSTLTQLCKILQITSDWLLGIDRGEETAIAMAEYHKARNAVYRAQKALQKENITEEEKQAIINQLQILIEQLK